MLIRAWRLLTIMLVTLSMAPALAHLLEMPSKMSYDGTLWLMLLQTLYTQFGIAGGAFEVGAVLTTAVLVLLVREREPAFAWTLAGAACMIAAHAAFWIWVYPVNSALVPLSPDDLPADWIRLRNQWEYTHAVRAILQIAALVALLVSILAETPLTRRIR